MWARVDDDDGDYCAIAVDKFDCSWKKSIHWDWTKKPRILFDADRHWRSKRSPIESRPRSTSCSATCRPSLACVECRVVWSLERPLRDRTPTSLGPNRRTRLYATNSLCARIEDASN